MDVAKSNVDENIGKKYNKLTIIKRVDDYVSPRGARVKRYLCRCDCGNEYITRLPWLICGKSQMCKSCKAEEKKQKMTKDLTGQKFGRWTVLKRDLNNGKAVYWICKCECGTIKSVRGTALLSGTSTSCGCYALEKLRDDHLLDLVGQKFERLTVIHQVDDFISPVNGKRRSRWHCKCDCGKEVDVNGSDLTSGNTLSCGCYKKQITSETHFEDLTGKKIGMLTIVKRMPDYISPESGRPRPQFLCKCDCGNEKIITKDSLMNGTISCGCINSRGEREISEYLQKKNYKYQIQYSFNDLLGTGGSPLHFDFAVLNEDGSIKLLIEFQGEQHYESVKFFGGEEKFKKQQQNDDSKRLYCKNHRIPLLEISYKQSVHTVLDNALKCL